MYLYKSLCETSDVDNYQSILPYEDEFLFTRYMNSEKKKLLESQNINKESLSFYADILASNIANLHDQRESRIKPELILRALSFCRDVLLSKGYEEFPFSSLYEYVDLRKKNHILVFGSQSMSILKRRVFEAHKLCKELKSATNVVFTGKRPYLDREAKIKLESNRMLCLFEEKGPLTDNISATVLQSEQESTNTIDNIDNFVDMHISPSSDNINIFLVSSNFHLIRIANIFENKLHLIEQNKSIVDKVILVGPEKLDTLEGSAAKRGEYVKSLFYEIYSFLFENTKGLK